MGGLVKGPARNYQKVEGYPAKVCAAAAKAYQPG